MNNTKQHIIQFELTGLSCMACVKKVNNTLLNHPQVSECEVTKARAVIKTLPNIHATNISTFIELIESLGYQAKPVSDTPKNTPPKQSCCHSEKNSSEAIPNVESVSSAKNSTSVNRRSVNSRTVKSTQTLQLKITGMTCASCVAHVEKSLLTMPNVTSVDVNLAQGTVFITGICLNKNKLIEATTVVGYPAKAINNSVAERNQVATHEKQTLKKQAVKTMTALIFGSGLMIWGFIGDMEVTVDNQMGWVIVGLITLVIMIATGGHFFKQAWKQLQQFRSNMDTLVTLGVGTAWSYSFLINLFPNIVPEGNRHLYYEASVMIIGLINLGKYLEQKAKIVSSNALEQLLDLTPQTAIKITNTGEKTIPLEAVKTGMLLRLRTGDRVAVDGNINSGSVDVDESMLTGEAALIHKKTSDTLFAGTMIQEGSVSYTASAVGEETQLAHIIKMVQQAQSSKPALARLADKISAIFVPIILIITVITAVTWLIFGPEPKIGYALMTTVSVLIIACPCALGLATPMSIITSVGRAAKLGILVRNAGVLERATHIDTIVFDKTGTITAGKAELIQTFLLPTANYNTEEITLLAANLETGSHHPLALALKKSVDSMTSINANFLVVDNFTTHVGLGVTGDINHASLALGNMDLLTQLHIDSDTTSLLDQKTQHQITHLQQEGATLVYFAINQQLTALFLIQDILREETKMIIQQLQSPSAHHARDKQYEIILLTGDNKINAEAIAKHAGINSVIAGVKPIEKAAVIKKLKHAGKRVAMVGDGINDAPALAEADLSIAMGHGSDIAKESADFVLLNNQLSNLPRVFDLANRVQKNMQQNLFFAFIYNIAAIPIAAGVLYPFTGMLLNPMIAAAAMALSSITVISNANRLLKDNY